MLCWICSRKSYFNNCVRRFIASQEQWRGLRFRCFDGDVRRMAEDLDVAFALPDVIIVDERDGWDIDAGVALCRALRRRECVATIIYVDMVVTSSLAVTYLAEIHQDNEFYDIHVEKVEMAQPSWELWLLTAVEESLAEPLAQLRSHPTSSGPTSPFGLN